MDIGEAMMLVKEGCRVTLRHWNDESYVMLHEGKPTLFIGNAPSNCRMRDEDVLSDDWYERLE